MAWKRQFIVTRNGEHVGWHASHEAAKADIARHEEHDVKLAHEGWISVRQLELTRYLVEIQRVRKVVEYVAQL